MVIVIRVAVVAVVAVVVAVVMAAVIAPRKGSRENPKKSSLQKKGRLPSGLLIRDRAYMGVINTPIDILPT